MLWEGAVKITQSRNKREGRYVGRFGRKNFRVGQHVAYLLKVNGMGHLDPVAVVMATLRS